MTMSLLSVEELSQELSVSSSHISELIEKNVIVPYGGKARLGEPRFSRRSIAKIRALLTMQSR